MVPLFASLPKLVLRLVISVVFTAEANQLAFPSSLSSQISTFLALF